MKEFTGERVIPGEVNVDLWNEHFARYAFAAEFARGRRVLDVGCGTGYGAAHLAQRAVSVTGLDISHEAVDYAREHFPIANLRFEQASASALPFADGTFDLITAFEVIEHLHDWADMVAEVARVLAPEGVALISTPNRLYYTASRGPEGANPFHIHEFDASEFESALSRSFAALTLLLQNRAECVAFYPHRRFPAAQACLESSAGSPDTAHFFLAICARRPELAAPRSFVYVPRAANILREREQHIEALTADLEELRESHLRLLAAHREQTAHLDEQNRWALATADELARTQRRVLEVQTDLESKVEWARNLDRDLAKAVEVLHETEALLKERTAKLQEAESLLGLVRISRWVRLGRTIGVGPDLAQ